MASADFSQFVVTTANDSACETSTLKMHALSLTYPPHLLVLPATFGLQCLLPPYPYFRALYAVPVRQARGLLTASFRFRLTADTLAVRLCASSLPTRTRDLHPLENAHAGQTKTVSGLCPSTVYSLYMIASIKTPFLIERRFPPGSSQPTAPALRHNPAFVSG